VRKLALLAAVAIALAVAGLWAAGRYWAHGSSDKGMPTLVVDDGDTVASVSAKLEDLGYVDSATEFRLFARVVGGDRPIQRGTYVFAEGEGYAHILRALQLGRVVRRFITIPEGMPSVLVQERLAANPDLTGPAPLPDEGSVLPNSYDWQMGESRAAVLARMQAAMDKTLADLWKGKKGDCPVSTPREAVILASIVEKETGKASERRTVAGVYCNRLRIGMKLDADPTVIYPITKGKPLGRRIRRSELNAITGYNTYREAGLPAGPIANPGRDSIAAVLNPAETDALYFVADGTGGHVFASTLAEHNANVEKWYAIRRARGEM